MKTLLIILIIFIGCDNSLQPIINKNSIPNIITIKNTISEKIINFKIETFLKDTIINNKKYYNLNYKVKHEQYYFDYYAYDNIYYKEGTILKFALSYLPMYIMTKDSVESTKIKWFTNKDFINIFGIRNFFNPDENIIKDNDTIIISAKYNNISDTVNLIMRKN